MSKRNAELLVEDIRDAMRKISSYTAAHQDLGEPRSVGILPAPAHEKSMGRAFALHMVFPWSAGKMPTLLDAP